MLSGLLATRSIMPSDIARNLQKDIPIINQNSGNSSVTLQVKQGAVAEKVALQ
jgi:hypothetical protein